jgi:hypothetical protein
MWLVGLVVGAIVGAMGHGGGAVLGAVVGGIAGWMFSEYAKNPNERYTRLEAIIRELSNRIAALEERNTAWRRSDIGLVSESQEPPAPTLQMAPDVPSPAPVSVICFFGSSRKAVESARACL